MPKILIVDDDPDFVSVTSTVLQSHGYETASASSGDQALQMMRQDPPDLVVLDVMMATILDGVGVSHAMRGDPALKEIPVIMISSIGASPHAAVFPTDEYIPIDAWITKPVDPDHLLVKVEKYLES